MNIMCKRNRTNFRVFFFMQVDSAWAAGNYEDAKSKSNIAKILNIIGFIVGSLAWVIFVVIIIASVATSASAAARLSNINN